ncbi:hypothetical protein ACEPAH_1447 [Sanghuangporus vaninii]
MKEELAARHSRLGANNSFQHRVQRETKPVYFGSPIQSLHSNSRIRLCWKQGSQRRASFSLFGIWRVTGSGLRCSTDAVHPQYPDVFSTHTPLLIFFFDKPTLHAQKHVELSKTHPELFKYLPYGPFETLGEFVSVHENRVTSIRGNVLSAILDNKGEHHGNGSPPYAGVVGLLNTSVANQCTEIGFITIFPEFQRTHVTVNAVGLLFHYCFELPSNINGKYGLALGLRRVQWQKREENAASVRAAERMGFRCGGLIRWQRILFKGKYGMTVPPEREALCENPGRHSWMLSVCWDDWELEGTREFVQEQMERNK